MQFIFLFTGSSTLIFKYGKILIYKFRWEKSLIKARRNKLDLKSLFNLNLPSVLPSFLLSLAEKFTCLDSHSYFTPLMRLSFFSSQNLSLIKIFSLRVIQEDVSFYDKMLDSRARNISSLCVLTCLSFSLSKSRHKIAKIHVKGVRWIVSCETRLVKPYSSTTRDTCSFILNLRESNFRDLFDGIFQGLEFTSLQSNVKLSYIFRFIISFHSYGETFLFFSDNVCKTIRFHIRESCPTERIYLR